MPDPVATSAVAKLVEAATGAVFGYVLEEAGLADRVRAWLGREPARLAFQAALLRALTRFAKAHPEFASALMDEPFFTREDVARELGRFLTRKGHPDVNALARAWAKQLPHVGGRYRDEAAAALQAFLRAFEEELGNQEALQPLFDSRALERIAANTEALLETLREQHAAALRTAERNVRIAGRVEAKRIGPEGEATGVKVGRIKRSADIEGKVKAEDISGKATGVSFDDLE